MEYFSDRNLICADDEHEFIGQIIDIFEDFLDERGIKIPNPDKAESGIDAANIYGMDYGDIFEQLDSIMRNWGVFTPYYNQKGEPYEKAYDC